MDDFTASQSFGDLAITAPGTYATPWLTGFDGIKSLTGHLRFVFGAGGTKVQAYLQTSFDQGVTAVDIWCVAFTNASDAQDINLSAGAGAGLTPDMTTMRPTDGALGDDQCVNGFLGDRFRLKYVVAGTYTNSTLLSARFVGR